MRLVLAALIVSLLALGASQAARADDTAEAAFWQVVQNSTKPADFEAYLRAYPGGAHAATAKAKLESLSGGAAGGDQGLVLPEDDTATGAAAASPPPAGPRITTGKAVFGAFEPVTLSWSDLPQASYIKIVTRVDGRSIGDGAVGVTTRLLVQTYWDWHRDPRYSLPIAY